MKKWFQQIGPATLVTAAFVGPGTVTVCAQAGVQFDFSLLWALLLSLVITIVLQEMAARIGLIRQKGLAEVLRDTITNKQLRIFLIGLIFSAIVLGNAAYEAGNINGAVMGLEIISGLENFWLWPIAIGALSFGILYFGNPAFLQKTLLALVLFMSVSFLITAILTQPDLSAIWKGFTRPSINNQNVLVVLALIGTTVVPYNLFLHASLVPQKWKSNNDLPAVRMDTVVAIGLGGLVSMAILVTGAAIPGDILSKPIELAEGLQPLFGKFAEVFTGMGLFAAGLTSSITAPYAAALVAKACFNWPASKQAQYFRISWMVILFAGIASLLLSYSPLLIIKFAQLANGVLLPIMAGLLWWMSANPRILGIYRNGKILNVVSFFLFLATLGLSIRTLIKVLT